jgi:hypothetical protein
MEKGIVEVKELLAGVKILAVAAAKVMKDGKLGSDDVGVVIELLSKQDQLVAAAQGLDEVGLEIKDLTIDEISSILFDIIDIAKAVKAV